MRFGLKKPYNLILSMNWVGVNRHTMLHTGSMVHSPADLVQSYGTYCLGRTIIRKQLDTTQQSQTTMHTKQQRHLLLSQWVSKRVEYTTAPKQIHLPSFWGSDWSALADN